MKTDKLFQVVKQQIDALDLFGLLDGGAPKDEFDMESAMVVARLRKGMTSLSIAKIIAQVMNEQFDGHFKDNEFIDYAERIEKVLNGTEL